MIFPQRRFDSNTVMKINGLTCTFNLPKALVQQFANGQEVKQGLPPYAERPAYLVDEYPACPENWMPSGKNLASYFVPVKAGHGIWLDLNGCMNHTHDVAALISIQGVNGITNQKVDPLSLVQYVKQCPVHGIDFGPDLFCEKCGYKWPAQNYMATTGTPRGQFWLDGFRTMDGTVRQYVFTEEAMRGIAAQVIGDERVFAIGIAFYLSRQPKPVATIFRSLNLSEKLYDGGFESFSDPQSFGSEYKLYSKNLLSGSRSAEIAPKRLEIAAGSRIDQQVYPDPKDIDYWEDEPAGSIVINYVDEETTNQIIAAGKRDLTAGGEGPLQGLRVGNVKEMAV